MKVVASAATATASSTSISGASSTRSCPTRYAPAALNAAGLELTGAQAQRSALCLAGAYTGSLLRPSREFTVSPGDLDEAVLVLLGYDYPSRDIDGAAMDGGFERVAAFRGGVLGGARECGLG